MSRDDVYVPLEPHELEHAVNVGTARYVVARGQGREHTRGRYCEGYGDDLVGAIGEAAVALALGVAWRPDIGGNDRGRGDVEGYHVRSTALASGSLIVGERDTDDAAVLVLVTVEILRPRACIRGWITAGEGRRVGEWRAPNDRPPAYFVPAYLLEPWTERPFLARVNA